MVKAMYRLTNMVYKLINHVRNRASLQEIVSSVFAIETDGVLVEVSNIGLK